MERLKNLSLKNKIFFCALAVILLISLLIALFTRWVVISSLTKELERRGLGIAQSIAESSRGFILTANKPELTSLLFDARLLGERKSLIVYLFVLDKQTQVLAHTFVVPFPEGFEWANPVQAPLTHSIKLMHINDHSVYDIAVPVIEGLNQVGTVHVGLNKDHIDQLISKLRSTFVGFISAVTILFFIISHYLSKYITRPLSELTKISDEISRGNFDIKPDLGSVIKCWKTKNCQQTDCPAYETSEIPCWYIDGTGGHREGHEPRADNPDRCLECQVYKKGMRDEVRQLASSFINMTNRIKRSQMQMKESEAKYRSLFTSGPNPIFVVDRHSLEILDANPSALETYGYGKAELSGRSFKTLGDFDENTPHSASHHNRNPNSIKIVNLKVQHFKKSNQAFYVNLHATPTRYQNREAFIVAATDITEMIEKDSLLIQASKMTKLGEMSAGIAHELNQPLNAVKMGSEFLKMMIEKKRQIDEQDLYEVVSEISAQVDRAADIINHLRDFGRKADFAREKIIINKPIQNVLEIVGQQLKLQNIAVILDLDESLPSILGHSNRLEQVIFNLLTNARDAINQKTDAAPGNAKREIRIQSGTENDHVIVAVADSGIGIPVELQARIFESFFTTKEMGEGMGLGLSITSSIVKDYGGDICVESKENHGTTVKLVFPQAPA